MQVEFRQVEFPQAESQLVPALTPAGLEALVLVQALAQEARAWRRPGVAAVVLWGEAWVATLVARFARALAHREIQA